jgi:drug/metabolite transporter (DMT)-like permease
MPHGWEWFWLLVLGLGTQAGQVCLTYALRELSAARATQIGYVGVIFAMALGVAMGDALPGWIQLGGAALIFVSLVAFRPRAAPATIAASAARE